MECHANRTKQFAFGNSSRRMPPRHQTAIFCKAKMRGCHFRELDLPKAAWNPKPSLFKTIGARRGHGDPKGLQGFQGIARASRNYYVKYDPLGKNTFWQRARPTRQEYNIRKQPLNKNETIEQKCNYELKVITMQGNQ